MEKNNRILQQQLELQQQTALKEIEIKERDDKRKQIIREESVKPFLKSGGVGKAINHVCSIKIKNFGGRAVESKYINNIANKVTIHIEKFSDKIEKDEVLLIRIFDFKMFWTDSKVSRSIIGSQ